MNFRRKTAAFTLVELSVVIVIVVLIISGVSVGTGIVNNFKLQAVTSDLRSLEVASKTFKSIYGKYQGDFNNAFAYWGTNCAASAGSCNGNGDGYIISIFGEEYMSFRHLALAGLIPGMYTGVQVASSYRAVPGTNVPRGPFSKSGYSFAATVGGAYLGSDWLGKYGSYGNAIWFGIPNAEITRDPVLTPSQTYSIDTKIDDGLPYAGKVLIDRSRSGCSVSSTPPTTYAITSNSVTCVIRYKFDK